MANNGNVDVDSLKAFRDKLEKSFSGNQLNLFIESCAKELAARLLAKVIKRTPVGGYYKDKKGLIVATLEIKNIKMSKNKRE